MDLEYTWILSHRTFSLLTGNSFFGQFIHPVGGGEGDEVKKAKGWFVKLSIQTFQPLIVICRKSIIRDVQQFIGHCLIPLDPWKTQ